MQAQWLASDVEEIGGGNAAVAELEPMKTALKPAGRPPAAKDIKPRRARLYIVDPHALLRGLLTRTLNAQPDLVVCGEAGDAAHALEGVSREKPDLIIIDLSLKDSDGIDLIKDLRIRHPQGRILVLSMYEENMFAQRVLGAGANGYISKEEDISLVLLAIRKVLKQHVYVSEQLAARILRHTLGREPSGSTAAETLSDREFQVMQLMGQGYAPRDIARTLGVDARTIATYRIRLREKLKLGTTGELTRYAVHWFQAGSATRRPPHRPAPASPSKKKA